MLTTYLPIPFTEKHINCKYSCEAEVHNYEDLVETAEDTLREIDLEKFLLEFNL